MTEKEALKAVLDGKKVIKRNWGGGIYMCFDFDNGKLKKVDNGREQWLISDDCEDDFVIVDETVLTDEERDYLDTVIAPFRDKVEYIKKIELSETDCYIKIILTGDSATLPCFDINEWFVNMENETHYTLGELGL